MTTQAKPTPCPTVPRLDDGFGASAGQVSHSTTEECLQHIEALGQRINGYVQFIGKIDSLNGTSTEAKEKAAAAFYEQMVVLERRLRRIQENLQLA